MSMCPVAAELYTGVAITLIVSLRMNMIYNFTGKSEEEAKQHVVDWFNSNPDIKSLGKTTFEEVINIQPLTEAYYIRKDVAILRHSGKDYIIQ